MVNLHACLTCGHELSPDSSCPRCSEKARPDDLPATRAVELLSRQPPLGETIAATVGAMPPVQLREVGMGEPEGPIVQPDSTAGADASIRYRIDGEIARGGMGTILKGRDPDLGRDVAIKVLRAEFRDRSDMIRRFVEEAQICGQLQHPGIVPIHELGVLDDFRPYFAMKLVKGRTLAAILGEQSAGDLPRLIAVFHSIAQTMAYAHARGVIHRDLKPLNVMVGGFGEVQVMDWGIAKVLHRAEIVDPATVELETPIATSRSQSHLDASQAGSILGSPGYMAPEQARGEVDTIDERADVFALGSILCEILTGKPAVIGPTFAAIRTATASGDLADAIGRIETCGQDPSLIALARDCLAPQPENRPRNAQAVATRVGDYLNSVQEQLKRAERDRAVAESQATEERKRRRLQAGLATSLLALASLGAGGFLWADRQWADRIDRTSRAVDAALADASRLQGEAEASPRDDVSKWEAAVEAARRAADLLHEGEGSASLKWRVESLVAEVDRGHDAAAERAAAHTADRALLTELEAARRRYVERRDSVSADAEFTDAFQRAGLDVDREPTDAAARWIRSRSEATAILDFVDEWAFHRRSIRDGLPANRIMAATRAADPDPARDALRAWIVDGGPAATNELRRITDDQTALDALSPSGRILLARELTRRSEDRSRAIHVLRRAILIRPGDVRAHLELGRLLQTEQPPRIAEAIAALETARALQPETAHDLAHLLARAGRPDEAEEVYLDLVRLRPDDLNHLRCLGDALDSRGRSAEAESVLDRVTNAYRKAIHRHPEQPGIHLELAEALLHRGRLDEAADAYREVIRLLPGNANARFRLGRTLDALKRPADALDHYRQAFLLSPDLVDYREALLASAQATGNVDAEIARLRELIAEAVRPAVTRTAVASLLHRSGRYDEAEAEAVEAIRLEPENGFAHQQRAWALMAQGCWAEAADAYREAIRFGSNGTTVYAEMAECLSLLGRRDAAVAAVEEWSQLGFGQPSSAFSRGQLFAAAGQHAKAVDWYHEALRAEILNIGILNRLHDEAQAAGLVDTEIGRLRELAKDHPQAGDALVNLAGFLRRAGRLAEAEAEARRAVQIAPKNAYAHQILGWSLLGQGRWADAADAYRAAIRLGTPHSRAAYDELAHCLDRDGRGEEAVETLRQAALAEPAHPGISFDLARFLLHRGRFDEAITAYRAAVALRPGWAEARCELGQLLLFRGAYSEALAELRRGHEIGSRRNDWKLPSARWVAEAERRVALSERLPAVIQGCDLPVDPAEGAVLAEMAYVRGHNVAAVRLWGNAFSADPTLVETRKNLHRYNAACAALLAASGVDKDDPPSHDETRTTLRRQALEWLRVERDVLAKIIKDGPPRDRLLALGQFRYWKLDADLGSIRDPDRLAQLPDDARQPWQDLWSDVDRILEEAGTGTP